MGIASPYALVRKPSGTLPPGAMEDRQDTILTFGPRHTTPTWWHYIILIFADPASQARQIRSRWKWPWVFFRPPWDLILPSPSLLLTPCTSIMGAMSFSSTPAFSEHCRDDPPVLEHLSGDVIGGHLCRHLGNIILLTASHRRTEG